MSEPERQEYLLRRAAQERVATKLAGDARAARAHQELAEEFGRLAEAEAAGDAGPNEQDSALQRLAI